jgi:hypothetical protein
MSETPKTRQQLQVKVERVHAARMKAEQFIDAGRDLNSKEAVPIGMELSLAADDLAAEFGHLTLNDTK